MDLRGTPTHMCPCGCDLFRILARFEDNDIALWTLDGECYNCGNLLTVPCPADERENHGS